MSKMPVTHILVLVDGTEASFRGADKAIELAHALGAKLTAIAVVDVDTLRQLLSVGILVDSEMKEFERDLEESSRRHLAEVRTRAQKARLALDEAIAAGNSEEIVPREVDERGVDLIVIGGFDSSLVNRDLVARQRQQILDHTRCPVLVVK